jgi:hypothetical protein
MFSTLKKKAGQVTQNLPILYISVVQKLRFLNNAKKRDLARLKPGFKRRAFKPQKPQDLQANLRLAANRRLADNQPGYRTSLLLANEKGSP